MEKLIYRFTDTFVLDDGGRIIGESTIKFPEQLGVYAVEFHVQFQHRQDMTCQNIELLMLENEYEYCSEIGMKMHNKDEDAGIFSLSLSSDNLNLEVWWVFYENKMQLVTYTLNLTRTDFQPKNGMKLVLDSVWIKYGSLVEVVDKYEQRVNELKKQNSILNELVDHPEAIGSKYAFGEISKYLV
jgi:hypothetical protein